MPANVYISMPSYGAAHCDAWSALVECVSHAQDAGAIVPTSIVNHRHLSLVTSRNRAVLEAIEQGATHVWYVDDDAVVPPNALERLLALDADVATGVVPCFARGKFVVNVRLGGRYLDCWPTGVFEVESCGLACALIKMDVFERIAKKGELWFTEEICSISGQSRHEDIPFTEKVAAKGMRIMCDASVTCGHIKTCDLRWFAPPLPSTVSLVQAMLDNKMKECGYAEANA